MLIRIPDLAQSPIQASEPVASATLKVSNMECRFPSTATDLYNPIFTSVKIGEGWTNRRPEWPTASCLTPSPGTALGMEAKPNPCIVPEDLRDDGMSLVPELAEMYARDAIGEVAA